MRLKLQPKWLMPIKFFPLCQLLQQPGRNRELDFVKGCCSNYKNQSFLSLYDITSSNPHKLSGARHYKTGMGLIFLNCLQFTAPTRALSIWKKYLEDSGLRSVKHLVRFAARKVSLKHWIHATPLINEWRRAFLNPVWMKLPTMT